MDKQTEFIKLIDLGISRVQDLMSQAQYGMYTDRYKKILTNLEDLKNATKKGMLSTSFIYLEVTKILDHNDPKQLEDVILAINRFYCSNFRILA